MVEDSQPGINLDGKLVAVIGAAATGAALVSVLHELGARLRVYDQKPLDQLSAAAELARRAEIRAGAPECSGLEECDLVIPSPGVPAGHPALRDAVLRGQPVLSEIEIAYRISKAPIVAVTGTNGKTTTTFMIQSILDAAGLDARIAGNALAGGFQAPLIRIAHEAPARAWIVAEISSFQLEWIERFRPFAGVITNIADDHGDRYERWEEYAAAKARLLENMGPDQWAVLNHDDPATRRLAESCSARILWFSRSDMGGEGVWIDSLGDERVIRARLDGVEVEVARAGDVLAPGMHNLENAAAAAAVALACGVDHGAVAGGLRGFKGVADRLESVAEVGGVLYVNNSMCTNVEAAVRSLEAFTNPLVVIAGGRAKTKDFGPFGAALARRARALVVIGEAASTVADAAREHGLESIHFAGSMAEAVDRAAAEAHPGDVVMLTPACASHDWYRGFEHRGSDFREQVRRLTAPGEEDDCND